MDFMNDAVRTEAPNFVGFGFPIINTSYEFKTFGTPATIIISSMDGPHWSALDHIFGKATAVVMSAIRSELGYS